MILLQKGIIEMFNTYYHGTIRKYIVAFGTLFNDIHINRINSNNETIQTMKVPLSYGPKEKFLARLEGDPNLDRPFSIVLPRIAFELVDISYDPERKLNTLNRNVKQSSANASQLLYQYQPVPYNLGMTLDVMAKNNDDATRIVEQILPYFTPQWTITLNLIPDLSLNVDVPVILNTTSLQDTYEGDFMNRRAIVWSLGFTLKAQLFGPVKKNGIIKRIYTNLYIPPGDTPVDEAVGTSIAERITITPGLLANGSPTANASASIDISLINADNNYGYIIDFDGISDIIT
jgi:hypothetical protein